MMGITHSYSLHMELLNSLCRLCAQRVKRQIKDKDRKLKLCKAFQHELLTNHNIDIAKDQLSKHPESMCDRCHRRIMKCNPDLAQSSTTIDNAVSSVKSADKIWVAFDSSVSSTSECFVCSHFELQAKAGRPCKPKVGAPKRACVQLEVSDQISLFS